MPRYELPPKKRRKGCLSALLFIGLTAYGLYFLFQSGYLTFIPDPSQSTLSQLNVRDRTPLQRKMKAAELPQDGIYMYSLTYCPPCKRKEAQLRNSLIPFTLYYTDQSPERLEELQIYLSKFLKRSAGMPVFVVDGQLLPDNPSVSEILAARRDER